MTRTALSSLAPAPGLPRLRSLPWQRLQAWYLPVLLAAVWWLASRNHWMSEQILPPPALVWDSAVELGRGERAVLDRGDEPVAAVGRPVHQGGAGAVVGDELPDAVDDDAPGADLAAHSPAPPSRIGMRTPRSSATSTARS